MVGENRWVVRPSRFDAFHVLAAAAQLSRIITDLEIATLLSEGKPLPVRWSSRLRVRPKANAQFSQRELEVSVPNGRAFRLVLRQNSINPLDFSIILILKEGTTEYVLVRHNGKHPSEHTNKIEKRRGEPNSSFRNVFHIHKATERYQQAGLAIDGYAEPTTRYSSFQTALEAMIEEYGFQQPEGEPTPLFDREGEGTE